MNKIERNSLGGDLLHTFVEIASSRNLTVAADRLGRTQSAISVQLRKLESGLGERLFIRTSKGMTLTPAGEMLLPRARNILAAMRETTQLFAAPLTGSIRVGFPDDFDGAVLEEILMRFSQAHPGVEVMAASGCTSAYPTAISEGRMDVAVYSAPDNRQGETLGTEKTVWAAKKNTALHLQAAIPVAILDRSCWWRDLPIRHLESAGRNHTVAFRSSSFSGLQSALRAGLAIGVLPLSCVSDGLQTLGREDGFPDLPASRRSILVSEDAPQDLAAAMADAIREARNARIAAAAIC